MHPQLRRVIADHTVTVTDIPDNTTHDAPNQAEVTPTPGEVSTQVCCGVGNQDGDREQELAHEAHCRGVALFLNGAGLTSVSWAPILQRLPGWRAIQVDSPGYGGTRPWSVPTLDAVGAALEEIVDDLGLVAQGQQIVVVAHSMGAFHAEALLRRVPALSDRLILVDPSMPEFPLSSSRLSQPLTRLVHAGLKLPGAQQAAAAALRRGLAAQTLRDDVAWDEWSQVWADRDALAAGASQSLAYRDQAHDLGELRSAAAPVSVLTLCAPPFPSREAMTAMREAFRSVTFRFVRQSRHLMMLDAPDVVARSIRDWKPNP